MVDIHLETTRANTAVWKVEPFKGKKMNNKWNEIRLTITEAAAIEDCDDYIFIF